MEAGPLLASPAGMRLEILASILGLTIGGCGGVATSNCTDCTNTASGGWTAADASDSTGGTQTTAVGGQTSTGVTVAQVQRVDVQQYHSSGADVELPDNSQLQVSLNMPESLFQLSCMGDFAIKKADGASFRDDRPVCGASPYYLGDTYVENPRAMACLGCDYITCQEAPNSWSFFTHEFVKTGERSNSADSEPVSVIEVRPTTGPYLLTVTYFTDNKCSSQTKHTETMLIDVQ